MVKGTEAVGGVVDEPTPVVRFDGEVRSHLSGEQLPQCIAQRRGKRIAAGALARRLGGILYALWQAGTRFDPEVVTGTGTLARQPQAA